MAWTIAAVQRANFMSGATRFSYRKSEAYFLAKAAVSRSLNRINQPGSTWTSDHIGFARADEYTANTKCWLEATNRPNSWVLRCQAKVGGQTEVLNVPVTRQDPSTSNMYSVAPAKGGGPDLVAWATTDTGVWAAIPPIPGVESLVSTAATPNGDVYSIGVNPLGTRVFRYRAGQGWVQMPDPPAGVSLSSLSAGGDNQLVCKGSDNTLLILPIGGSTSMSMNWSVTQAPTDTTLGLVSAHPLGNPLAYATATSSSGQAVVYQFDGNAQTWAQFSSPNPVAYDAATGTPKAAPSQVPNFSGGITVDKNGVVYAASNVPNEASIVYAFRPSTAGSSTGTWTALPPVPAMEWVGTSIGYSAGLASNITQLRADRVGNLWGKLTDAQGNTEIVSLSGLP